ncbi:MAG TPA: hypothetical protein VFL91_20890 [Thermomicrobiales bacterium]|nr:hypothetical protein [Thermomicrobiales bacterium]
MDDPLLGDRPRADYTAAERRFSQLLRRQLDEVLEGRRGELWLLRRYPGDPHRLGVPPLPPGEDGGEVRLAVAEGLVREAIAFVCPDGAGGPTAQEPTADGGVLERRAFATRYPHIVLERVDRFAAGGAAPAESAWCLRRVQNQRAQVRLNRLLDAANLALEVAKLVRP